MLSVRKYFISIDTWMRGRWSSSSTPFSRSHTNLPLSNYAFNLRPARHIYQYSSSSSIQALLSITGTYSPGVCEDMSTMDVPKS